jgi:hypothetical protein
MKSLLALMLLCLQTSLAFADTSALVDLKNYLSSPARFEKASFQLADKRVYDRAISKEDFVEVFNATVTLCKAEVVGNNILISEINSRSLVLGPTTLAFPFSSARLFNKMYKSTVSYWDETPTYFESPSEFIVSLAGEHPVNYEMSFNTRDPRGYFDAENFKIEGIVSDGIMAGEFRAIQCGLTGYLQL